MARVAACCWAVGTVYVVDIGVKAVATWDISWLHSCFSEQSSKWACSSHSS